MPPILDRTLQLAVQGYAFVPRHRPPGADVFELRLLGRRTPCLAGPDGAALFYDESRFERSSAIPRPLQQTLFGVGGVQVLDGAAHRRRKAMFLELLTGDGLDDLAARARAAWARAGERWTEQRRVVLFDEAAEVLTRAVWPWTGLPLAEREVRPTARDLVALVDGFGSAGPRHWRARRARNRLERRVGELVEAARAGQLAAPAGSALAVVAAHRDVDGALLRTEQAAVELLNVIRPTVAVAWYVAFAAHALHRWPEWRDRLREGDEHLLEAFAQEVRRWYPSRRCSAPVSATTSPGAGGDSGPGSWCCSTCTARCGTPPAGSAPRSSGPSASSSGRCRARSS